MLTYSFEKRGKQPLYEYLYNCIRDDILTGTLRAGERLPGKRSFAENLGVSPITVETAYAQLQAEGYIQSEPRRGFFVSDVGTVSMSVHREKIELPSERPPELFADFAGNQTDPDSFPFSVWSKIMRELLSESGGALLTNAPAGGISELRTAIAGHLREFRGLKAEPEQIVVGAGTEYLYSVLIQLLGVDKVYAVEDPGYDKPARVYMSHGAVCRRIGMDAEGVLPDRLVREGVDVVHISPSHHFPTGIVMPVGRRYELLAWASRDKDRYIIEDDYDSEFRLNGRPIPTLRGIDAQNKVIYMNTFTKTLASTVRIAYMVLPVPLAECFYRELGFYSCTVSNFEQYALARFIGRGYFEKHLNRMRGLYRDKRDRLLSAIRESGLSSCAKVLEEDAGLHFLLRVETKLSDARLCERAEQKAMRIRPLSGYYSDPASAPEHTLVINYSSLRPDRIREAVERLKSVIAEE